MNSEAVAEAARCSAAVARITAAMASRRVEPDGELLRSLARLAAKGARCAARAVEYSEAAR